MMATARRLGAAAVIVFLAACGIGRTAPPVSAASSAPPLQEKTAEAWHVLFLLSGGFAGINRELQLASTGELTARDRRRGTSVTAKAPADDLARIAALVADAKSVSPGRPTGCRDCLQYDLDIHVRGESLEVRADDTTLASSGTEPLARSLIGLLDRALTGRLK